ncbi:MAG: alpha-amylase family glycosyl hydrolase [Anaerolineae bacterium]|jgi:glycosidase|nr:alpha-amylase family glycosyl hydrolase [Anaerolineae bacterium]
MLAKFALFFTLLTFSLAPVVIAQESTPEGEVFWWNDRTFYQIFVRSFYDSDGDGVGDFRGLTSQLDYLNDGDPTTDTDLGITGIWLMPITESPSYHGYDVVDYYAVDQEYGTKEDFQAFLAAAHERGIAVIIDLVLNHTSSQHPWFLDSQTPESPYEDWYIWEDENPNYSGPTGQTVWHRRAGRYYYGLFWSEMPDLNYANPDVTAQMYDVTRFWLEEMGVDGFRLDAVKHMVEEGRAQENTPATHQWMQAYYDFVRSINPEAVLVAEIWSATTLVLPYIGDEVDIAFEFDLAEGIVRASGFGLPNTLRQAIEPVIENYPAGQYATFLTNHDQNRVMTVLRGNLGGARIAASVLLTLPGVPFIYYGEEIGMVGEKPDELIRTPLQWDATPETAGFTTGTPWQAVNPDFTTVNIAAQTDDPDSLLSLYRGLIQLRGEHSALRTGNLVFVQSAHRKVLSYLRTNAEQTVLVILNMDDRAVTGYDLTLAAGPLSGAINAQALFGIDQADPIETPIVNAAGGFDAYVPTLELAPHSVLIIQLGD